MAGAAPLRSAWKELRPAPVEGAPVEGTPPRVRHLAGVALDSVRSGIVDAGPLALAGLAANGATAVVTVLVARLLDNRAYGSLAQLFGLFLVVSMPGSAVTVAVVRRVTGWSRTEPASTVRRWAVRVHARGALLLMAFTLVVVLLRGEIDRLLSSPNSAGVVVMLVAAAVWVLLSLDRGLLQAHREYRTLATNLVLEGGGRVVATFCLVGAGLGVVGAALGVLLAELATSVHARIAADRAWSLAGQPAPAGEGGIRRWWKTAWGSSPSRANGATADRRGIVADLLIAFPSLALLALLQNVDIIVQAHDDPHASGIYAAISVISKALVIAAVALGGYLLPEAAIRWQQGGHALRQLALTLMLLGCLSTALLSAALLAPHLLVTTVFSPRYAGASSSLAVLVVAMIFLSITVTLTMYLLAVGCRWIALLLLAGAVASVVAVGLAHGAPSATANHDLMVQIVLAAVTCAGFAVLHLRRRRAASAGRYHRIDAGPRGGVAVQSGR